MARHVLLAVLLSEAKYMNFQILKSFSHLSNVMVNCQTNDIKESDWDCSILDEVIQVKAIKLLIAIDGN